MQTLTNATNLVFIDLSVEDSQALLNGVMPGAEAILLDPQRDGIEQITAVLGDRSNINSLHIVSHGTPACLHLGSTQLHLGNLSAYAHQLRQWTAALTPDADILIYGCNVAMGEVGKAFVHWLSLLTDAKVAASASRTGSAAKGGDWLLEYATGQIKASLAFQSPVRTTYKGVFATPSVQWLKQLGTAGADESSSIAVDSAGNIYATGYTADALADSSQGGEDAWAVKYDSNGNQLWLRQFGTASNERSNGIAVDGADNFYLGGYTTGDFGGNNAGSEDAWLAQYDSSGNQQWVKQLGTASNDRALGVAVASSGYVYTTGYTNSNLSGRRYLIYGSYNDHSDLSDEEIWTAMCDTQGNQVWVKQQGSYGNDRSNGIAVSNGGQVYFSGYTEGSLENSNAGGADSFIANYYSTCGNYGYIRQFGSSSSDYSCSIQVDGSGNLFMAGYTAGALDGANAGIMDAWFAKYDSSGYRLWMNQLGTSGDDRALGLALDSNGNVYVAGYTTGALSGSNSGGEDAWVAMYDTWGHQQWVKQFGTASNDRANGVAVDSAGNVYLSGYTEGALDGTNAGAADAWVAKFGPNTAPALAVNGGLTLDEEATAAITAEQLQVTDTDWGEVITYAVTALPTEGTLILNDTALALNDTFTQADIDAGKLSYSHDGSETTADTFTFTVTDSQGSQISDTAFQITLNPVNDAPSDITLSANSIDENSANGTAIGTLSTADAEANDTHTYTLVDDAGGRFTVEGDRLSVLDGSLLDWETASSHTIRLCATDSGTPSASFEKDFTINLGNINDAPTDISLSNSSVGENSIAGTVIGTLSTTDPDVSDTHTYTLLSDAEGRFTLEGNELKVAQNSRLDVESGNNYTIRVRISDNGTPSQSFEKDLTISLSDAYKPPTLANNITSQTAKADTPFTFQIPANTFHHLNAGDSLTYSAILADGNPLPNWLIFDSTTLTLSGTPARGDAGNLSIKLTATDSAGTIVSDTFDLSIAPGSTDEVGEDTIPGDTGNNPTNGGTGDDSLGGDTGNNPTNGGTNRDFNAGSMFGFPTPNESGDLTSESTGSDATFTTGGAVNNSNDTLIGSDDGDALNGFGGNDLLVGFGGSDNLSGGDGNDRIYGNIDTDNVDGGNGDDTLFGGKESDTLTGSNGVDIVCGDFGNDSIDGGDGNDLLYGKQDADFIDGGSGEDTLFGGKDNDTLIGAAGSDTLGGDLGDDSLSGSEGNDVLYGNIGADTLDGGTGDDSLFAGKDSDVLLGSDGADFLCGDLGEDSLTGGGGSDRFFLSSGRGSDTILDFEDGIDSLVLSDGLSFEQLAITPGANAALIAIATTGELLASLEGIEASAIAINDFHNNFTLV